MNWMPKAPVLPYLRIWQSTFSSHVVGLEDAIYTCSYRHAQKKKKKKRDIIKSEIETKLWVFCGEKKMLDQYDNFYHFFFFFFRGVGKLITTGALICLSKTPSELSIEFTQKSWHYSYQWNIVGRSSFGSEWLDKIFQWPIFSISKRL